MQATRDHDNAPGTAEDTGHQEQRADAASDADSEDDLLNQVGLRLYSASLILDEMLSMGCLPHTENSMHAPVPSPMQGDWK